MGLDRIWAQLILPDSRDERSGNRIFGCRDGRQLLLEADDVLHVCGHRFFRTSVGDVFVDIVVGFGVNVGVGVGCCDVGVVVENQNDFRDEATQGFDGEPIAVKLP